MPAYRFSWDPFDDRTVLELARDLGFRGSEGAARAFLADKVVRPNDDFVRGARDTLARVWLPQHVGIGTSIVRELFDRHIGPRGTMPEDAQGCADYIKRCRNSSGLRDLLFSRLISYGDLDREGGDWEDDGFVPRFGILQPKKQQPDARPPYSHQEEAWRKLSAHLDDPKAEGTFKGVLVMPTGSGKTFTAARWLTQRWLDAGNRVLWLAHREELLAQAARAFADCASAATSRDHLRMRQVSGRNCRFHQIDPEDHIICCSVASLARADEKQAAQLLHDPRLFVVIDEAHHAPAKSYRDAIKLLEKAKSHRLLGLTATPTRTAEQERPELARLFGGRVLHQVSMKELIAKELLARPIPANVKTNVDAETGMTAEDRAHLVTFHEPSPDMLARLGRDERRNRTIVEQYKNNAARYGKTLVFTTDVAAAALLAEAFRHAGIEAQYLASYRPDHVEGQPQVDRRQVLRDYLEPRSGLDVLINVDMLTEGVDLPITRTVFLARPTSSEILFRQMVGRALRGPKAGGNREAHIVSFEDHWSTYGNYLDPLDWITEEGVGGPGQEPAVAEPEAPEVVAPQADEAGPQPSWDQVLAVVHAIRAGFKGSEAVVFEAVPDGMFVLDYEAEGVAVHLVIHVSDHQRPCWEALFAKLRGLQGEARAGADAAALEADFFGDCEVPKASPLDVATVVERFKAGDMLPEYVPLQGRAECDPHALARLAHDKDLKGSEIKTLLVERHSKLARVIYPTSLEFRRAFDDAVRELEHPEAARPPKGVPMFEPPPSNPLRPGPCHDLRALMDETLSEGAKLLGRELQHRGELEWTRRPMKGWFGMATLGHQAGVGRIRISVLLDSPDVSAATLKFLLWHEYLHLHLMALHTEEFRRLERLWPGYIECDREMDSLNERFGVQYW
jgi:superfamily II DNA or RNA helicase